VNIQIGEGGASSYNWNQKINWLTQKTMAQQISTGKEQQRMFELGDEEMWTPFLENINKLMIDEKQAR
jgi:hypothetical protein